MYWKVLVFIIPGCILSLGCAGPTTPFGSVNSLTPVAQVTTPEIHNTNTLLKLATKPYLPTTPLAQIKLTPDRQVLHDHMDLTVAINDRYGIGNNSKLVVTFNGQKVKSISDIFVPPDDHQKGYVTFKNVRLRDDRENQILTSYIRSKTDKPVSIELLPPDCTLDQTMKIAHTGDFETKETLLKVIEEQAKLRHLNPSLLTGVIAQESAFDPHAISWAKAIGLTQVTPIGDMQISDQFPDWPRSSKINNFPVSVLKTLIASNQLTAAEDWRLDPKKSIIGGVTLMDYMKSYWQRNETEKVLEKNTSNGELDLTALTLASYHSGPIRVRRAIVADGDDYLNNTDLKEANRYVRRVKSYCYHFAKGRR